MPKVSVIIPYFKGQAYLEECVQSIEEQKIEDLEIIVVNCWVDAAWSYMRILPLSRILKFCRPNFSVKT